MPKTSRGTDDVMVGMKRTKLSYAAHALVKFRDNLGPVWHSEKCGEYALLISYIHTLTVLSKLIVFAPTTK